MAALYLERFMNYGLTPDELRSGKFSRQPWAIGCRAARSCGLRYIVDLEAVALRVATRQA